MASFYNRDAFSDLMESLRIQGTPMVEGDGRGGLSTPDGSSSGSPSSDGSSSGGGDFFQSLYDMGAFGGPSSISSSVQGPGFSVGDIGSTAYMPAGDFDGSTEVRGFSSDTFGTSQFRQPINISSVSADIGNYGFDIADSSALGTDLSGGMGPFQSAGKLYPGDAGYNANTDLDSYYASQGMDINPITGKFIDLSRYNVTGGGTQNTGAVQNTTAIDNTNAIDVVGQRGGQNLGAADNILAAGDINAIDVIGQQPDEDEQGSTFVETGVEVLSDVTGLPLDDIYEIVTTAERPADLVINALGSLGINIPDFDFGGGEPFEVREENLLPGYFDPAVTDGSGLNDNTTAAGGDGRSILQRTAIRGVVPGTYDPNRRAGSGGQRYFSDIRYVPNVSDPAAQRAANLEAQAAANAQAMLLAAQNAANPAYQVRPVGTSGTTIINNTGYTGLTGSTSVANDTEAEDTLTSPYTYTSESLFEGIDPSDGFDATEVARVAALINQDYTTAGQVGEFFNVDPEYITEYLGDYNTRAALINSINEANQSGDRDAIADLLTSGQADIGTVNALLGSETTDVLEGLLRGGYQTPEETVAMLQGYGNEGFDEEQLIALLLDENKITPREVSEYYGIPEEVITQRYAELGGTRQFAQGGNVSGYYLGGTTDGMADQIPATINNMQPAALSDGEFVIPADVVSHLGNGNSDAGAKELYSMMDRIRRDRTGTTKQGKEIDPNKYLA